MKRFKKIKLTFVVVLNIALFYYFFIWAKKNINFKLIFHGDTHISYLLMLYCVLLSFPLLLSYGKRLSILLDEAFRKSFLTACIGHGINSMMPFRLGDVLRLFFAKKFYAIPYTKMFIATVMEKYIDLIVVALLGIYIFLDRRLIDRKIFYALSALFIISLVAFVLIFATKKTWLTLLSKYKKITETFEYLSQFELKECLGVGLYTIFIWGITILTFYLYFKVSLSGSYNFSLVDAIALVFVATLSFAIPSVPGNFGVFEAAIIFYLTHFIHVPPTIALVLALALHLALNFLQVVVAVAVVVAKRNCLRNLS